MDITTLTLTPGVTVGPLDDTGSRTISRYGAEIGTVSFPAYLGAESAETYYSVTVGGRAYRGAYRPLTAAVLQVVTLAETAAMPLHGQVVGAGDLAPGDP